MNHSFKYTGSMLFLALAVIGSTTMMMIMGGNSGSGGIGSGGIGSGTTHCGDRDCKSRESEKGKGTPAKTRRAQ